jgi:hypothetical protein
MILAIKKQWHIHGYKTDEEGFLIFKEAKLHATTIEYKFPWKELIKPYTSIWYGQIWSETIEGNPFPASTLPDKVKDDLFNSFIGHVEWLKTLLPPEEEGQSMALLKAFKEVFGNELDEVALTKDKQKFLSLF